LCHPIIRINYGLSGARRVLRSSKTKQQRSFPSLAVIVIVEEKSQHWYLGISNNETLVQIVFILDLISYYKRVSETLSRVRDERSIFAGLTRYA
jgi:hypothetical protein